MTIGCNHIEEVTRNEKTVVPEIKIEKEIEINDYDVPRSISKVFTSRLGYDNLSTKIALFQGEGLASDFQVVDAQSKEVVYKGSIEKGKDSISYGYFTELEREGTYYIQTDIIGQSYEFELGTHIYQNTLKSLCDNFGEINLDTREILSFCDGLILGLIALDFYPEIIGEEGEFTLLPILRVQVEELVALAEEEIPEKLTVEEQTIVAGTLAKFYNMYQGYDKEFAQICLRQAEEYWIDVKNNPDLKMETTYFLMTELYKATGYEKYHSKIKEFHQNEEISAIESNRQKIFGDITYQTTRRRASLRICNDLMEMRLKNVQLISDNHSDFWHREENEQLDQTMLEILEVIIVDHLFESKAYLTTLTDKVYYLMGCNPEGINYFDIEKIELKIDEKATLILLLSGIMSREILLSE